MPKFNAIFAANVRCYATVTIEAADEDAAQRRFGAIALLMGSDWPDDVSVGVFEPEYDTLTDIEYLEDCGIDEIEE